MQFKKELFLSAFLSFIIWGMVAAFLIIQGIIMEFTIIGVVATLLFAVISCPILVGLGSFLFDKIHRSKLKGDVR